MNKYTFLYLIWLLPAYLAFLFIHQGAVYQGISDTYENGSSYTAEITEFELKQIAAQTNGYVVLKFDTASGQTIQRKLSLPVEMAGSLQNLRVVPVRYQADAYQEIVMMPTFEMHKRLVLTNMGMALLGALMTLVLAIAVHRYANRKMEQGEEVYVIEMTE